MRYLRVGGVVSRDARGSRRRVHVGLHRAFVAHATRKKNRLDNVNLFNSLTWSTKIYLHNSKLAARLQWFALLVDKQLTWPHADRCFRSSSWCYWRTLEFGLSVGWACSAIGFLLALVAVREEMLKERFFMLSILIRILCWSSRLSCLLNWRALRFEYSNCGVLLGRGTLVACFLNWCLLIK